MAGERVSPVRGIAKLVTHSMPSFDRPRLAEEYERKLAPVDGKAAGYYAANEVLLDEIDHLVSELYRDEGVIVETFGEDENSLVTSIESVQAIASNGSKE